MSIHTATVSVDLLPGVQQVSLKYSLRIHRAQDFFLLPYILGFDFIVHQITRLLFVSPERTKKTISINELRQQNSCNRCEDRASTWTCRSSSKSTNGWAPYHQPLKSEGRTRDFISSSQQPTLCLSATHLDHVVDFTSQHEIFHTWNI